MLNDIILTYGVTIYYFLEPSQFILIAHNIIMPIVTLDHLLRYSMRLLII